MFAMKISMFFLSAIFLQSLLTAEARPSDCGCGSFGGGLIGGYNGVYGGCGFPLPSPITPPISFAPVPQPVPIKVPVSRPQSVTIPNIILALLPPTNKPPAVKPCLPPQPKPIVFPLPQPYPIPVADCGCN